jgi:uncharacterized SAM-binding protein YcdF (DUF218 family)
MFGRKRNWDDQYDRNYMDRSERPPRRPGSRCWIHVLAIVLTAILLLGTVGAVGGQAMFEKTITALVSPVGLIWLSLFFLTYVALVWRQTATALIAVACWLMLTLFGNSMLANRLMYSLEKPHLAFDYQAMEKLDVVFLLGGGSDTDAAGHPRAAASGDRIVTAAKLYHAGKVAQIVCTGIQLFRSDPRDQHPCEEAAQLLIELGVPESAISMIKGTNTSEEMKLAAQFLQQQGHTDAAIGIVTSAYHLNRASRLAQSNGLNPVLIPANVRSTFFAPAPENVIPTATALDNSAKSIREFLARLVNR